MKRENNGNSRILPERFGARYEHTPNIENRANFGRFFCGFGVLAPGSLQVTGKVQYGGLLQRDVHA